MSGSSDKGGQPLETWPSSENNKRVICEKLINEFSQLRHILEIGSGTGQHAVWFANHMPHLVWQTSDRHENLEFIRQRFDFEGPENLRKPIELDVSSRQWPSDKKFDAVFSANCIHIMSWDSVRSMFAGIANILEYGGKLALYGPFKYGGEFTTPSNEKFDLWLKSQDKVCGIRDFEAVNELAENIGLKFIVDHQMPANNQLIVWGQAGD